MEVNGVNEASAYKQTNKQTEVKPETRENVDLKKAKAPTTDESFEKSGLAITKETVKANQDGIRTSAGTKQKVADAYNATAKAIYDTCAGGPPELKAIAQQYIAELPKTSRRAGFEAYTGQLATKLEGFRNAVRANGLGHYLEAMDNANEARATAIIQNSDQNTLDVETTVVSTGAAVVEEVNQHTDKTAAKVEANTKKEIRKSENRIKANDNRNARNLGRQIDRAKADIEKHTTQVGEKITNDTAHNLRVAAGISPDGTSAAGKTQMFTDGVIIDYENTVNGHTTKETDRGIQTNLKNQRAIHGVDEYNKPLKTGTVAHTSDGKEIKQEDTTLGAVGKGVKTLKDHANALAEKSNVERQKLAVLQSKRQAISDMLGHEDRENFGVYRDITVKWLGSSADRVFADKELTFEKKKEALDELTRMIDEESVISAKDKEEFENKYFKETTVREHDHL